MRDVRVWLPGTLALALLGCGASNNTQTPTDAAAPTDNVTVDAQYADAPRTDAPRTDAPRTDAGAPNDAADLSDVATRASAQCTSDDDCAGLSCDDTVAGGFCSADCTNSASQVTEQRQCGRGGTCLGLGDGDDATTFCARACSPTARTESAGACRAGTVCTGWWYTHDGAEPDRTGCDVFCATDANCETGQHCHPRTGYCEDTAPSTTLRADGEPCDPTREPDMGPSSQCRGICFSVSDNDNEGICGSLVNLALTMRCPDLPDRIAPEAPSDSDGRTDNLGLCISKSCTTNADCTAPLQCNVDPGGGPSLCDYASNGDAVDGGVADAGRTDAAVADAAVGDVGRD